MSLRHRLTSLAFWADDGQLPRRAVASEASLAEYEQLLMGEAYDADVPGDLLKAMCWHASGWRQYEPGGRVLSTPGRHGTSWGAMQLSEVWHPDAFPEARESARANIRYAARLLRWLYEQTGDWRRAAVMFFGHDRQAEAAARRVVRYSHTRPWQQHGSAVADGDAAAAR